MNAFYDTLFIVLWASILLPLVAVIIERSMLSVVMSSLPTVTGLLWVAAFGKNQLSLIVASVLTILVTVAVFSVVTVHRVERTHHDISTAGVH